MPKLTIVIGANGAGKSTWCQSHREELPEHFYNADSIAQGLGDWNSPTKQRAARELVDSKIKDHLEANEDFGFESTYSGRSRPGIVERAKALGYETKAVFIGTRRPEINIERVASRVAAQTGHDVPTAEVQRRWTAAQDNLVRTAHAIARIDVVDNSARKARNVIRIENARETARKRPTPRWAQELAQRIETEIRKPPLTLDGGPERK